MLTERVQGRAGRSAALYRVNESAAPILAAYCELKGDERVLSLLVVSVTGRVLTRSEERLGYLDARALVDALEHARAQHPEVVQVSLGVPGIIQGRFVRDCDISELDGAPIVSLVENALGLATVAGNDMHTTAYGLYRELGIDDEVVTVAYFPEGVRPGTATVYRGVVVEGAGSFAGMVGFVPTERGGRLEAPAPADFTAPCPELVARCLASVVTVANPDLVLCTGELVDEKTLEEVDGLLASWIPRRYLPQLEYRDNMENGYVRGLVARALDARLEAGALRAAPLYGME